MVSVDPVAEGSNAGENGSINGAVISERRDTSKDHTAIERAIERAARVTHACAWTANGEITSTNMLVIKSGIVHFSCAIFLRDDGHGYFLQDVSRGQFIAKFSPSSSDAGPMIKGLTGKCQSCGLHAGGELDGFAQFNDGNVITHWTLNKSAMRGDFFRVD